MKKKMIKKLAKVVLLCTVSAFVYVTKDTIPFLNIVNPVVSSDYVEEFNGDAYVILNNNKVDFSFSKSRGYYLENQPFDALGRCQEAKAIVGLKTLAHEERSSISGIKPSGWHTVRYDDTIEDKYLYNRGHLIMFALYGNATNVKENLITQTRYSNSVTQLYFENQILDYIEDTGNDVEYHVRPDFHDSELVARGVELQAISEDGDFQFHVYIYNIQPGIHIDYATGESYVDDTVQVKESLS